MFEIAVRLPMEADQNCHDFTQAQGSAALTRLQAIT
jgi:hypothetical protein